MLCSKWLQNAAFDYHGGVKVDSLTIGKDFTFSFYQSAFVFCFIVFAVQCGLCLGFGAVLEGSESKHQMPHLSIRVSRFFDLLKLHFAFRKKYSRSMQ